MLRRSARGIAALFIASLLTLAPLARAEHTDAGAGDGGIAEGAHAIDGGAPPSPAKTVESEPASVPAAAEPGAGAATDEEASEGEDEDAADAPPDDEEEVGAEEEGSHCFEAASAAPSEPPPFAELSDEELSARLMADPRALGSMSLGRTNSGALIGGVQMLSGERWEVINPRESWGTFETVDFIAAAIDKVHEKFPGSARVRIGDISDENGGDIAPHLSHQAGRDADIGWFYKEGLPSEWATRADANNLDLPRSWAFLRAFITETDVQLIFVDRKIQGMLYEYALSVGEDRAWLDKIFQYPTHACAGIIRHARGHLNHFHVRLHARKAQELGRRAYRFLLAKGRIRPPVTYVRVKVKRGQTLGRLAKQYRTTVSAIQRANGLRSTLIRAGKDYRIPRKGGVEYIPDPVSVPPRRRPPFNPSYDRPTG